MPFFEAKNVNKSFPGVKALVDVSLVVNKGEVHSVVGENGAGKSTLMKILGGLYSMDSGQLLLDGENIEIKSIADAQKYGISVIYQELDLMPDLTVAENIFVGNLPGKGGLVDYRALNDKAQELIDSLSLEIKPTDYVSLLSVSQRQMVEILKALSQDSELIIMDEPTASLNNQEVSTLYDVISKLKERGKAILYISHRLQEVFDLSDRVTVLRDGQFIDSYLVSELNETKLVEKMVGRDISQLYQYKEPNLGKEAMAVKGLCKEGIFTDITFSLRAGEVVGMAGLMGCGREAIGQAIYGLLRCDEGVIVVNGEQATIRKPSDAIKHGIGFVTDDRKDNGIFALMSVRDNITINIIRLISKLRFISARKERELLAEYTKSMNMKYTDEMQRIMFLSGGNQQKFVLARALAADCNVLILCEPTRGIDVGAKAEIYQLLTNLSQKGYAILLLSSELPEIMSVCYRALVVFQGKITGNILHDEMNENLIMQCATGHQTYFSKGADL